MEKEDKKEVKKEISLEDLKKKLEECQKQSKEYLAGWQRARADFLNYKKAEIGRTKEIIEFANSNLILEILPILDNFDLIEKELPTDLNNNEYIKGIFQVKTQLEDFLKNQGIEQINCLDNKFDPNFQEAVEEVETKNKEPGIVIEEIQKGYLMNGKVLRPAKVKISK